MNGTPSNETTGHDEERVDRLGPIQAAITALAMPYLNTLKVLGILDAIELQIEDGGDSEDVNALLLDALRAAVRHQVGEDAGAAALRAIDAFAQIEAKHWEDVRAGRYQSPADRPAASHTESMPPPFGNGALRAGPYWRFLLQRPSAVHTELVPGFEGLATTWAAAHYETSLRRSATPWARSASMTASRLFRYPAVCFI